MCTHVNLITDVIESELLSAEEEAFADRLIAMVNHGMAGLMIAIGHRTGLFSAMKGGGGLGAAWSEKLALAMLADAGVFRVDVRRLPHDQMNSYFICRPD